MHTIAQHVNSSVDLIEIRSEDANEAQRTVSPALSSHLQPSV